MYWNKTCTERYTFKITQWSLWRKKRWSSSTKQKNVPMETRVCEMIFLGWPINQDHSPTNLKAIREIKWSKKTFAMKPRIGRGKCSLSNQGQNNWFIKKKKVIVILPEGLQILETDQVGISKGSKPCNVGMFYFKRVQREKARAQSESPSESLIYTMTSDLT